MGLQRISEHITDSDHATVAGRITRAIGNWANYRTPGGLLVRSAHGAEAQPDAPPDWKATLQAQIAALKPRVDEIDERRAILKQAQDALVDNLRDSIPAKLAGGGRP